MADFDYDVLIVGSGFGGGVAALRAAEKGYRVGAMQAGKRWHDEDIPKGQWHLRGFPWFPAAELYGIRRVEYLDDVLVPSGAGVGGGSHVYANTLYVPPKQFFDAPEWASITDWADELAPATTRRRGCSALCATRTCPLTSTRVMQEVAIEMGRGETFNKAPVGVYFGSPGVEAEDAYFGGMGQRRTGCVSSGKCNIGCGYNAKNKRNEVVDLVELMQPSSEPLGQAPSQASRRELRAATSLRSRTSPSAGWRSSRIVMNGTNAAKPEASSPAATMTCTAVNRKRPSFSMSARSQ